jgi:hypothetical protein
LWERLNALFSTEGASPKKLGVKLSGKRDYNRTHLWREPCATKGVKLSGKRTEKSRITPIFLCPFLLEKDRNKQKGGE